MNISTEKIDFRRFISEDSFKSIDVSEDFIDIISRVQEGDISAFNELDVTYRNHLLSVAFRRMDDKNYAKDIVQDVLSEILILISEKVLDNNSDQIEQEIVGNMFKKLSWLTLEIGSEAAHFRDKFENKTTSLESSSLKLTTENISDDSLDWLSGITESERLSEVQRAVESLNSSTRKAIELSFYHNRTTEQMASDLNIGKEKALKLKREGIRRIKAKLTA